MKTSRIRVTFSERVASEMTCSALGGAGLGFRSATARRSADPAMTNVCDGFLFSEAEPRDA